MVRATYCTEYGQEPGVLVIFTCVIKVVLSEFSCSVHKVSKVGQQLRVVLQHEILPLEGGVLVLRSGIHQIEPGEREIFLITSLLYIFQDFDDHPETFIFNNSIFFKVLYKIILIQLQYSLFLIFPTRKNTLGIPGAVFIKYNLMILLTTFKIDYLIWYSS